MHNERLKLIPPVPQTLQELGHILENMQRYRDIYISTVYSGNEAAILFGNEELLTALEQSEDLAADGTFKVNHCYNL